MNTISAESIQLEAQEKNLALLERRAAKALLALEDALAKLNHLTPMTLTLQDLIDAKLCVGEAKEWLSGANDAQLQPTFPAASIESERNPRCPTCGEYDLHWNGIHEVRYVGDEIEGVCSGCGEPYWTEITELTFSFWTTPREAGKK